MFADMQSRETSYSHWERLIVAFPLVRDEVTGTLKPIKGVINTSIQVQQIIRCQGAARTTCGRQTSGFMVDHFVLTLCGHKDRKLNPFRG